MESYPDLVETARIAFAEIAASPMRDWIGAGDPVKIGLANRELVRRMTGMARDARVLDFGCGLGRTALALLGDPNFRGQVVGVDIVPQMVEFCRRIIGDKFRNSEFYCTDAINLAYEKLKSTSNLVVTEADFFGGQAEKNDIVLAFSVFTHLVEADAVRSLKLLATALKPRGSALISVYILDDESRLALAEGTVAFRLDRQPRPDEEFFAADDLQVVAFTWRKLKEMVANAGLRISAAALGYWRARPSPMGLVSMQDLICLQPIMPLPPEFDPHRYVSLHPDLMASGVDGTYHYLTWGFDENRRWR